MQIRSYCHALGNPDADAQTSVRSLLLARLWETIPERQKEVADEEERQLSYILESARLRNLYLLEGVHRLACQNKTQRLHQVFVRMALGV